MRVCFVSLSLKVSFLFSLLACCQLVAHPVGQTTLLGAVVVIRTGQHLRGIITIAAKRAISTRSSSHASKDAFMVLVF